MGKMNQRVDVICQHCRDGSIIPIKLRMEDEDGIRQEFVIKSYREVPALGGGYTMPNGVRVNRGCTRRKYECAVSVFGRVQRFHLLYDLVDLTWMVET